MKSYASFQNSIPIHMISKSHLKMSGSLTAYEDRSRVLTLWKKHLWQVLKPNPWMYNFLEVSGHNLESSQTWGFGILCSHYKPVSNHFSQGGGAGVKSVSNGDLNSKADKTLKLLSHLRSRIRPLIKKRLASCLVSSFYKNRQLT
jgi:hypothetical protein